jgi:hypothetical protein
MTKTSMKRPIKAAKSRPVLGTVVPHDQSVSTRDDWAAGCLTEPNSDAFSADFREKMKSYLLHDVYRFGNDFPREYTKVKIILGRYCDLSDEELRWHLGQIIYVYRGYNDAVALNTLDKCISNAKRAANSLDQFYSMMPTVHFMYADLSLKLAYDAHSKDDDTGMLLGDYREIPALIKTTKLVMRSLYESLGYLADRDPTISAQPGRPPIRYVFETYLLMRLWSNLTHKKVVYPKGKEKDKKGEDEALQHSTEFIRLCLKMINPKITLSNAQTCIKAVREGKTKIGAFVTPVGEEDAGLYSAELDLSDIFGPLQKE